MFFSGLTLDLDATYLVVLGLVLIPFVILNGLVFRPFLKMFEERHERVEGALARAEDKLEEAEDKAKAFEQKISVATQKGVDKRNELRATAQKAMADRLEAAKAEATTKVEAAVTEIRASRATAMAAVETEARKLAEATAAKLLGRGI